MPDDNIPASNSLVQTELVDLFSISEREIVGTGTIPTVSARDLHAFLEVGTKFADWIRGRIRDYGFTQDVDFVTISENSEGGAPKLEYHLSFDMGKELSMVERNEKGREARRYFLECEKRLREAEKALDPMDQLVRSAIALRDHDRRLKWLTSEHAKIADEQVASRRIADSALEAATEARKLAAIAEAKAQASSMAGMDFTILAYARILDLEITLDIAKKLGGEARRLSDRKGAPVGRARDPRFGWVNTYVESILEEIFRDYLNNIAEEI